MPRYHESIFTEKTKPLAQTKIKEILDKERKYEHPYLLMQRSTQMKQWIVMKIRPKISLTVAKQNINKQTSRQFHTTHWEKCAHENALSEKVSEKKKTLTAFNKKTNLLLFPPTHKREKLLKSSN